MDNSEKLVVVKCCPGDPGDGFLYSFVVAPIAMDVKTMFDVWLTEMDGLRDSELPWGFRQFDAWLVGHGCRKLMPDEVVEVWSDEGQEQFDANH